MDINVKIEAPEIATAIHALAAAIAGKQETYIPASPVASPAASIPGSAAHAGVNTPPSTVPTAQLAAPTNTAPAAPTNTAPAAPANTVPTTVPTYTLEQLSVAATQLMDAPGHSMEELTALLAQFGVQALTQLPPEQYGAFATLLRAKGARI